MSTNESTLLKLYLDRYSTENGLSRTGLANKLGFNNVSTLTNKLNGAREISFDEAHSIAELVGAPLDVIYFLATH